MSDGDDRMLRIRYSRRRFSGHAIPLGMMDDLKAVSDAALDVTSRLLELSSLEDGWGENGDEVAPDADRIRTLMDRYDGFATGLRLPRIFPTVEGNLEFEWDSDELSVLEVDLATMQGVLYTDDDECEVDLESSEGWATVISKVGADDVER